MEAFELERAVEEAVAILPDVVAPDGFTAQDDVAVEGDEVGIDQVQHDESLAEAYDVAVD